MDLTYLLDVKAKGGRVHQNLAVDRLISRRSPDGHLTIGALKLARGGPPVEVDHVVLAAGAVGSAALMVRSAELDGGLARSPARASFGVGLGFNYGNAVLSRFHEQPARPGDTGVQINFIASKASDERFVLENAFLPPALMSTLVPAYGAEHPPVDEALPPPRHGRQHDRLAADRQRRCTATRDLSRRSSGDGRHPPQPRAAHSDVSARRRRRGGDRRHACRPR